MRLQRALQAGVRDGHFPGLLPRFPAGADAGPLDWEYGLERPQDFAFAAAPVFLSALTGTPAPATGVFGIPSGKESIPWQPRLLPRPRATWRRELYHQPDAGGSRSNRDDAPRFSVRAICGAFLKEAARAGEDERLLYRG